MKSEVLDRWCERVILALVLTILVFGPLALGAVRGLEFGIIEGLTVLVMLAWAVRLWAAPRPRLLWPPICWAVLAFTVYAVVRYLTADIEYIARQELFHILVYAFLFLAIINNLQRQETTQVISFTLVFLAMAISFYALYQFLTGSDRVWTFLKPYHHRGSGTYICPNHLGGFLEMVLPLGLAYTLTGRVKPVTRILLGYASLVIVAGIAATVSRGAWISTGLSLALFFFVLLFQRYYRLPALALLIVLGAAGAYVFPKSFFMEKRLNQMVDSKGRIDDDMRFALWRPAVRMWQDHLWWGVGPAHFDSLFRAYRPESVQMSPDRTHNDYLNTLADYGLAGGVLVAGALGLLAVSVAKTWRAVRLSSGDLGGKPGRNKFAFLLGGSVGLIALLFHSVVDFNMHIPANALLATTLMALLAGHIRFATEDYWVGLRHWSQGVGSVVLLLGIVCIVPQAWRAAGESVWLARAERAPSYSPAQADLLRHAFELEPKNSQTAFGIGEALRHQSEEGGQSYAGQNGVSYQRLAQEAMDWFSLAMKLNPHDSRSFSSYGWCLDWLDRQRESEPYFARAEQLDPNNYFNLNSIGLHYVQLGDFAASRPWFERSLRLNWQDNLIAQSYLQIANLRLLEAATNELNAKLSVRGH